jgi:hypothetical protein
MSDEVERLKTEIEALRQQVSEQRRGIYVLSTIIIFFLFGFLMP